LLSEGEKKRLALATVLMRHEISGICLDEPTLGQDERHRRLLGQILSRLAAAGYLCLVASHDLGWALEWADRILMLRGGRLVAARGRPEPPGAMGPGRAPPAALGEGNMRRRRPLPLAEHSFLRGADPRTKLTLSLAASVAVMLPLARLAAFFACYLLLVAAAGLVPHALAQLRRLTLLLVVLFALDWLFIGLGFAALITLRLALLSTAFSLFFATTTPDELRGALEQMRVPSRLAFTFATAYRSLALVEDEWRGIIEAQRARGIFREPGSGGSWRAWRQHLASAASLVVPAVVLTTQRAWSLAEAAAVRGLESPLRRPCRTLRLARLDYLLLAGAVGLLAILFALRWGPP
jgi:energy-coupling factor transporter transmembrane protein EcfT